jgi:hypothetical protein
MRKEFDEFLTGCLPLALGIILVVLLVLKGGDMIMWALRCYPQLFGCS